MRKMRAGFVMQNDDNVRPARPGKKSLAKMLDRGGRCSHNYLMLPEAHFGSSTVQPGQPAPGFDLPDADMKLVRLVSFRNRRNVVLYFYPKDDTPGCTMEAIDFSELEEDFGALKAVILGVSMDDCLSHGAFRDKHGLSVQLLADVEGDICRRYGVVHDKIVDGRKKACIVRSTFIIDRKGVVQHALYGVNPRGHAEEVLGLLKSIGRCK
jgi:thioredoxin-dependent peroxiredoxin